jgi:two-component system CheB/CheR fusion protein
MPGMNGYELAVALRQLPNCQSIPMIAVTGFSQYDDRARAIQSGFNAHLTKPINPMTLLELIERLRD